MGVIFYELIFGRIPWDGKDEKVLLTNILSQKLKFPSPISPEVKDVLCKMLAISEHKRLSWEELFTMFDLLRNKTLGDNGFDDKERITIHRSVIQEMIDIEMKRIAQVEFKKPLDKLDSDQIFFLKKILESLLGEEHFYIIREFLSERKAL